jgi:hypothetical protein
VRVREGLPLDLLDADAPVDDVVGRGLAVREDGRLVLTRRGRLLADAVVRDLTG